MLNKLGSHIEKYLGSYVNDHEGLKPFLIAVSETFNEYEDQVTGLEARVASQEQEIKELNDKLLNETGGLKNAHSELSRIFNQVNEGFFTKDIFTGKYIHMSVGCEKIYGYPINDFYTNTMLWYQVIHPDDRQLIEAETALLNQGVQTKTCYRIIHKNNTTRWIEVKALPVMVAGRLTRVDGVVNDITERKMAEKSVMESEVKYRSFFETNMDGILLGRPNGFILEANPAACEMFRVTENEFCKYSHAELMDFADPSLPSLLEERSRTGQFKGELNLVRGDGTKFRAEIHSTLFNDANGEQMSCIIVRDITERKKAEEQITQSEERYRQIVETAQEGIWMMDAHHFTVFVNKKMCALFEYTAEEMIGKLPTFFLSEEGKQLIQPSLERRRLGISENIDLPFVAKSGKIVWVTIAASPIMNNEGVLTGCLTMVTDITKRKLDEALIREAQASLDIKNKELKRINTELEQFAYVASHDLQEPLRTMSSFVKLLQRQYEGKLDEQADHYLNFIVDASERMKTLIRDLLEFSRIGSKHEREQVNCNKIMADVKADLYKAITESGAAIISGELPVISAYPTEIKQLFQNLTTNAIKFRKPGIAPQVKITAALKGDHWLFSIADNGIGIDKAQNERIFVIFQRLHVRSEYEGSGIGLSHCKKIVELHHGRIWVESVPGEGSVFYFTIPR